MLPFIREIFTDKGLGWAHTTLVSDVCECMCSRGMKKLKMKKYVSLKKLSPTLQIDKNT